jgi:hypothetical protein
MENPPFSPHDSTPPAMPDIPIEVQVEVLPPTDTNEPPSSEQGRFSTEQLLKAAQELLKNPLVLAGGAALAGFLISRLAGNRALRDKGVALVVELLRNKFGNAVPTPPTPAPAPESPKPKGFPESILSGDLPRVLKEKVAPILPVIGDSLKKRLAEMLRK